MNPLKVAMVTPWNERNRLSEYSFDLTYALSQRGLDITVIAPERRGKPSYEIDQGNVKRRWKIAHGPQNTAILNAIEEVKPDVVHIQCAEGVFSGHDLSWLAQGLKVPAAITFHDNTSWFKNWSKIRWAVFNHPDLIQHYHACEEWQEFLCFPGMFSMQYKEPVFRENPPRFNVRTSSRRCDFRGIRLAVNQANSRAGRELFRFERLKEWLPLPEVMRFMQEAHIGIYYYKQGYTEEVAHSPMHCISACRPMIFSNVDQLRRYDFNKVYTASKPSVIADKLIEISNEYDYAMETARSYRAWCEKMRTWNVVAEHHIAYYNNALEGK